MPGFTCLSLQQLDRLGLTTDDFILHRVLTVALEPDLQLLLHSSTEMCQDVNTPVAKFRLQGSSMFHLTLELAPETLDDVDCDVGQLQSQRMASWRV